MSELALRAFLTLFVVVDPIGIAPVFIALAGGRPAAERGRIARKAVAVAGVVLLGFALFGSWLFERLGISMDAFRIAGGVLLFRIAVGMVLAAHERETREEQEEARARQDVSVFPLAIPLIAGPGALASMMILVAQAGAEPRRQLVVVAMAALVLLLTWLALRLSALLGRLLHRTGVNVVTRVLGVLLAALAVQYVADGVRGLLLAR
ncbi:MAG TPA: MarC family protein [Vicinamibacteria bacterium]|nr:MarC family protein [Vicinamibacteria bacterium]